MPVSGAGSRSLASAFFGGGGTEVDAYNRELARLTAAKSQSALMDQRVARAFQESTTSDALKRLIAGEEPGRDLDLILSGKGSEFSSLQTGLGTEITNEQKRGLLDRIGTENEPTFGETNLIGAITGGGRTVTGTGVDPEADQKAALALKAAQTFSAAATGGNAQARTSKVNEEIKQLKEKVGTGVNLKPSALSKTQLQLLNGMPVQQLNPNYDPDSGFMGFNKTPEYIEASGIEDFYAFQAQQAGESLDSPYLNADYALMKYLEFKRVEVQKVQQQKAGQQEAKAELYSTPSDLQDAITAGLVNSGDTIMTPDGPRIVN